MTILVPLAGPRPGAVAFKEGDTLRLQQGENLSQTSPQQWLQLSGPSRYSLDMAIESSPYQIEVSHFHCQ